MNDNGQPHRDPKPVADGKSEPSTGAIPADWTQARAAAFLDLHRGRINHLIKEGVLTTNAKTGRECRITETSILGYKERRERRKREEQQRRDDSFV